MHTLKKPELIAPAGDRTSLITALNAGADAIYFGAESCNMRARSRSFNSRDFHDIASLCQEHQARSYLALNTLVFDNEIEMVNMTVAAAKKAGIDAVICWDVAAINACRTQNMPFHLSTQASVSNYSAVSFYASLGAKMIVLARELTIEQVNSITEQIRKDKLDVAIECFVHGAMCVAVSGRCFLSQDIFGRSANRGACLQPCRRRYRIIDEEEGFELEIGTDTVMSPKDLCAISLMPLLIDSGITGFKIEGRNRSPEYVHTTTSCYRQAIDYIVAHRHETSFEEDYQAVADNLTRQLKTVYNREFSSGFYFGKPFDAWTRNYGSRATEKKVYLGTVLKYYPQAEIAEILIHSEELKRHDKLSIQGTTTGIVILNAESFHASDKPADTAAKGEVVTLPCNRKVRKNDKVYLLRPI